MLEKVPGGAGSELVSSLAPGDVLLSYCSIHSQPRVCVCERDKERPCVHIFLCTSADYIECLWWVLST